MMARRMTMLKTRKKCFLLTASLVFLSFLATRGALPPTAIGAPAIAVSNAMGSVKSKVPVQVDSGAFPWSTGAYTYDGAGNITRIGAEYFNYDTTNRLTDSYIVGPDKVTGSLRSFGYDNYGNQNVRIDGGVTRNINVDPSTNRLTSNAAMFDEAGNMTRYQALNSVRISTYQYDALDMMQQSTNNVGGNVLYIYTADDERIWTFDLEPNPQVSHWTIRDLGGKVLRDYKDNGTWTIDKDYFYRDGALLAAINPGADTLEHYSLDHLGTPRLITNESGVKVGYHSYFAFGGEWTPGSGPAGQEGNHLKFTGHERDGNPADTTTEMDYMHARFYLPGLGRFMSEDPSWDSAALADPQTWNRYSYAKNNPVRFTDPDGKIAVADDIVIGLVIGTAILSEAYLQAPSAADPNIRNGDAIAASIAGGIHDIQTALISFAEHVKGARPSTTARHQKGQGRKAMDRGGEKGDERRRPPRVRPPKHKGKWPPDPPKSYVPAPPKENDQPKQNQPAQEQPDTTVLYKQKNEQGSPETIK
jgi:RHS repeat-associated protein